MVLPRRWGSSMTRGTSAWFSSTSVTCKQVGGPIAQRAPHTGEIGDVGASCGSRSGEICWEEVHGDIITCITEGSPVSVRWGPLLASVAILHGKTKVILNPLSPRAVLHVALCVCVFV